MKRLFILLLAVGMVLGLCINAWAGTVRYPTRSVRVLSVGSPGTVMDMGARQVADSLRKELKQPFMVVPMAGGGGNVAANMLMASPTDGYSLLVSGSAQYIDNFYYMDVEYKFDDLIPISLLNDSTGGMLARKDRGWNTLNDVFDWAKANNQVLRFGFQSPRPRVWMEQLAKEKGLTINLVPMLGGPELIAAILGNHVDFGMTGSIWVEHHNAGTVKGIGVTSEKRSIHAPDVPTFLEQGYDFVQFGAWVVSVKKGTPDAIVDILSEAMKRAVVTPEYIEGAIKRVNAEAPVPGGKEYALEYLKNGYNTLAKEFGRPTLP